MRETPDQQLTVPLTALIGFPGAGKTTLLNRILNDDHGLRFADASQIFAAPEMAELKLRHFALADMLLMSGVT